MLGEDDHRVAHTLGGAFFEVMAGASTVISVDTKKELVGHFKNAGREWHPTSEPVPLLAKHARVRGRLDIARW